MTRLCAVTMAVLLNGRWGSLAVLLRASVEPSLRPLLTVFAGTENWLVVHSAGARPARGALQSLALI